MKEYRRTVTAMNFDMPPNEKLEPVAATAVSRLGIREYDILDAAKAGSRSASKEPVEMSGDSRAKSTASANAMKAR